MDVNILKLIIDPLLGGLCVVCDNDRGEPVVSYRWTGWVWEITGWSSRLQENYPSFERNLWNIPQFSKEEPKDVNMWLVGLGNTRMSTDYAQKSPQTLFATLKIVLWPSWNKSRDMSDHWIGLKTRQIASCSLQLWLTLILKSSFRIKIEA